MKKIIFSSLFAALMLFSLGSHAQFGVQVGMKGGLSLSQYSLDNPPLFFEKDDMKLKPGFNGGLVVNFDALDLKVATFSFQPEFLYYQKGVNFKNEIADVKYNSKTSIDYFHVPFNLKLKVIKIPVYLIAGPYFSYATAGTETGEVLSGAFTNDIEFGYGDNKTMPIDLGVNFGTGFQKDFFKVVHFFAEVRLDSGLLDINTSDSFSRKNMNVGINAGVMFGL